MNLGEVAGVAVNSKGHIFQSSTARRARGSSSSIARGVFIREIGKDLTASIRRMSSASTKDDNHLVRDEGTNTVIKFNPAGHVQMVLGEVGAGRWPPCAAFAECAAAGARARQLLQSTDGRRLGCGRQRLRERRPTTTRASPNSTRTATGSSRGRARQRARSVQHPPHDRDRRRRAGVVGDRTNRRIQVFHGRWHVRKSSATSGKPWGDLHHAAAAREVIFSSTPTPGASSNWAGRHAPRLVRLVRQTTQAVRMDPRDLVSVRPRTLRRRTA